MFEIKFVSPKWVRYGDINLAGDITLQQAKKILEMPSDYIYQYLLNENILHFGLVSVEIGKLKIFTDPVSSFPILLRMGGNGKKTSITDNIERLKSQTSSRNTVALKSILNAGYCLGTDTIIDDVKWISPFSCITIKEDELLETNYFKKLTASKKLSYFDIEEKLVDICRKKISTQVSLPLSAGYDSKFLARLLKNSNKSIKSFSYGPKKAWDVEGGRAAAHFLNIPWKHLYYKRKEHKVFCNTIEFKRLRKFSNLGVAMFYYQDAKIISDNIEKLCDTIVINGNTGDFVTGGHLNKNSDELADLDLEQEIYESIYKLWLKEDYEHDLLKYIRAEINRLAVKYKCSSKIDLKYFFELENRQSKYVLSGQRVYDFFDLEWYLPFWWPTFLFPHLEEPKNNIVNQNPFSEYLKKNKGDSLFNAPIFKKRHNRHFLPRLIRKFYKLVAVFVPKMSRWEKTIFIPWLSTLHQTALYSFSKRAKLHPINKETAYWAWLYLEENS